MAEDQAPPNAGRDSDEQEDPLRIVGLRGAVEEEHRRQDDESGAEAAQDQKWKGGSGPGTTLYRGGDLLSWNGLFLQALEHLVGDEAFVDRPSDQPALVLVGLYCFRGEGSFDRIDGPSCGFGIIRNGATRDERLIDESNASFASEAFILFAFNRESSMTVRPRRSRSSRRSSRGSSVRGRIPHWR